MASASMFQRRTARMRLMENKPLLAKWLGIAAVSISGLWVAVPVQVKLLMWLMVLDLFTGVLVAFYAKAVESRKLQKGLLGKVGTLVMIGALSLCESSMGFDFHVEKYVAFFFIVYELTSLVENAAALNVPIPAKIVEFLKKARVETLSPAEVHRELSVEHNTETISMPAGQPDLMKETETIRKVVVTEKPEEGK